jgi:CheY-like chemotaxis protein
MDIINDLSIIYLSKIKKLNKNITLVLDNNTIQLIESDRYIIEECLHRLLDNAIKFSDSGNIHIGFYTKEKNITIYVKDNGIGIENKHQEIIFDRFRQINKQTVGSGLGLSIFKSFVNLLDGKYSLISKLNEGTLISFTLKLKYDITNNQVISVDLSDIDTSVLKGKRILVAEDLEVNQLLINDILLPYNVNIIKCMDGRECIDKFLEIKDIDLILMDLDMPYMDGYEATKIIRQTDKVIPIIAQTAYSQKENRERARKIGFNDFLVKPITTDSLLKIILKNI